LFVHLRRILERMPKPGSLVLGSKPSEKRDSPREKESSPLVKKYDSSGLG